jgi:hypothetical protein
MSSTGTSWWKQHDYNALCDVCGIKRKASQLTERWDSLMVCRPSIAHGCWETRHPQESIQPARGPAKLPFTRPEPPDVYVTVARVNFSDPTL